MMKKLPVVTGFLIVSLCDWGGWSEMLEAGRAERSLQCFGSDTGVSCGLGGMVAEVPGSCVGGEAGGAFEARAGLV